MAIHIGTNIFEVILIVITLRIAKYLPQPTWTKVYVTAILIQRKVSGSEPVNCIVSMQLIVIGTFCISYALKALEIQINRTANIAKDNYNNRPLQTSFKYSVISYVRSL